MIEESNQDKQWIINRTESILEIISQDLETRNQKFAIMTKDLISVFDLGRNILFAFFGFAISIIIGLSSLKILQSPYTELSLIITIVIIFSLFALLNYVKRKVSSTLPKLERSMWKAKDFIGRLKMRIIDETVELENISLSKLKAFYKYNFLATSVSIFMILDQLKQIRDGDDRMASKMFGNPLSIVIAEYEKGLLSGIMMYEMVHDELKENGYLDNFYGELLQPFINYYNKNLNKENPMN